MTENQLSVSASSMASVSSGYISSSSPMGSIDTSLLVKPPKEFHHSPSKYLQRRHTMPILHLETLDERKLFTAPHQTLVERASRSPLPHLHKSAWDLSPEESDFKFATPTPPPPTPRHTKVKKLEQEVTNLRQQVDALQQCNSKLERELQNASSLFSLDVTLPPRQGLLRRFSSTLRDRKQLEKVKLLPL